jgi:hypothetical protein
LDRSDGSKPREAIRCYFAHCRRYQYRPIAGGELCARHAMKHQFGDHYLDAVVTNHERFIHAARQGETLEPSFTNLQPILDTAMEAEVKPPGKTMVVDT